MDFFSSNYEQTNSFNLLLTNLRYKNECIYFKSKSPIKLKVNNKTIFKDEFLLKDLSNFWVKDDKFSLGKINSLIYVPWSSLVAENLDDLI